MTYTKLKTALLIVCLCLSGSLACGRNPDTFIREEHYPNGQLKAKGAWFKDKNGELFKHGDHSQWYEDGSVEGQYSYRLGLMHGKVIQYNPDGTIRFEAKFKNGKGINE